MVVKHRIKTCYERIQTFLEREAFSGFSSEDLFIMQFVPRGWGQDIAALSNMAEGLRNLVELEPSRHAAVEPLLTEVVERALSPYVSPFSQPITKQTKFGNHGYYLEHLNIILGCYQAVYRDTYRDINQAVTKHLVDESLSNPHYHAKLLPHISMRWCADQAAIIYSIWLYDRNNGTDLHADLAERWLEHMRAYLTDEVTGLFHTEALNVKRYSRQPRGCALSYLIYYSSHFAPDVARDQWVLFKRHMLVKRMGLAGFREYLPTYHGKWTPDTGPIIADIGVAASALAMKAAMAVGDQETFMALERSSRAPLRILEILSPVPLLGRLAHVGTDLLASSILLSAVTTSESQCHPGRTRLAQWRYGCRVS